MQRLEREPTYFEQIEAYFRAAPAERFPTLADLARELTGPQAGPGDRFEFGLEVIVLGLSTIAAQGRPGRPRTRRAR